MCQIISSFYTRRHCIGELVQIVQCVTLLISDHFKPRLGWTLCLGCLWVVLMEMHSKLLKHLPLRSEVLVSISSKSGPYFINLQNILLYMETQRHKFIGLCWWSSYKQILLLNVSNALNLGFHPLHCTASKCS